MKQFFYRGVTLTATTLKILEVEEKEDKNVITVPKGDGVTYYFPDKSDFEITPKVGDRLTVYTLGSRYYGMDINGMPQFRKDGFEEREAGERSAVTKVFSYKGIPITVMHQEIIKVEKIHDYFALIFGTGYGIPLHFEHVKSVPVAGDIFTTYMLCNNRIVRGDLNGVEQFRCDGFEEKDA